MDCEELPTTEKVEKVEGRILDLQEEELKVVEKVQDEEEENGRDLDLSDLRNLSMI